MEKNILRLSQMDIVYPFFLPKEEHLLVLGGRTPDGQWLKKNSQGRMLWAVDRGVEICKKNALEPLALIGDADSADKAAWDWGESHARKVLRFAPKKDLTDTQLALDALPPKSFAILAGAFGGRFDHSYSTIFSAAYCKTHAALADEKETMFFLRDGETLTFRCRQKPMVISLLPMTEVCSEVSLSGTYWPLVKANLYQAKPYAISNEILSEGFSVAIGKGVLGVYLLFG